jgi:hypothetical protein
MRCRCYRDTFIKFPKYPLFYFFSNQCISFTINNVNNPSILLGHTFTFSSLHNQLVETQRVIRGGREVSMYPLNTKI